MGFNTRDGGVNELLRSLSTTADRAYVGSLLAYGSQGGIPDIKLMTDDFYDPVCAIVFESIKKLALEKTIPELILVREAIVDAGKLDSIGGNKALTQLMDGDYNYQNIRRYEFAVKENKRKRDVEKLIHQLESDDVKDSAHLLKMGQQLIGLATNNGGIVNKGIPDLDINNLADKIGENEGKHLFGYSFGPNFAFLDEATKGLRQGKTYRIGAPSNVGKSQLMYSVINNLLAQGAKVAFFTLENDMETTLSFLMSNHIGVQNDKMMNGSEKADFDYLVSIKNNLTIVEDVFEINNIFSRIMEIQPDIVILDYIGLMSCKGFTEEQKYTEYAIQVQRFVKASQVCWMDLSNLPTQLQQAEDIKNNPQYFGSTFLRNNTDVGIHITPNKEFYDLREKVFENCKNKSRVEYYKYMSGVQITLSKNRLGPHSLNKKYIVNYAEGGKWQVMDGEFLSTLELNSL